MKIKVHYYDLKNALISWNSMPSARHVEEFRGAHIEVASHSKCCICGKEDWYSFNWECDLNVIQAILSEGIDDGRYYGLDFMPLSYMGFPSSHTFPVYICEKCGYVNFDLGKKIYGITKEKLSDKYFSKKIKLALENDCYELAEKKGICYTRYNLAIDLYEESNKLKFKVENLYNLGVLYLVLSRNYPFIFEYYSVKIPKEKIIDCLNKSLKYFSEYLNYCKDIRIELICIDLMRRLKKYKQAKKKASEILNKLIKKSIIDDLNSYMLQYQIILCDKENDSNVDIQEALEYFNVFERFNQKKVDNYIGAFILDFYVFSKRKTIMVNFKKYCLLNIKQRKRICELKKGHRKLYPWYYEKSNDE